VGNIPASAPSRYSHSGVMQIINSLTVAGAVLGLFAFSGNAPASRLTFKKGLEST